MPKASETNQGKANSSAEEPPTELRIGPSTYPAGWIIGGDGGTEPPPGGPPESRAD
jgi:hypothetical protein